MLLTVFSIHSFHYYRSLGIVENDALLSNNKENRISSIMTPTISRSAANTISYNHTHNGSSDGFLGDEEYHSQFEISSERNLTIYWEHNGTFLFWAAIINNADVSGYFAIGWPEKSKTDANMNELDMIFVFGNDSGAFAIDNHATGRYSHGPDTNQGRIVSFAYNNQTDLFVEMTLRMAPDDSDEDKPLEPGATYEFWFIWHTESDELSSANHERHHDLFLIEPAEIDTDRDELSDADELLWGTNSTNNDTDGDGLGDGWEAFWELNGSISSPIPDPRVYYDPVMSDTDGDGTSDANEDYDADSLISLSEAERGTNPRLADTDGDSLTDGDEVHTHGTDPLLQDTDRDGLSDSEEIAQNRNPLVASANILFTDFHQGAVDGAITKNEYRSNFTDPTTKVVILWEHDGEFLFIALASNTSGWISFGWSTGEIVSASGGVQMTNMDMVIGRVASGNVLEVTDHHGTSNWTHAPDLDFAQIEEAKGLDNGYTTTLEFAIRLRSSDEEDVPLIPGDEYYLAMAFGIHDELGLHDGVTRTSEQFYIAEAGESGPVSEESDDQPFLDLMTIIFLVITGFLAIGIVFVTLYRSEKVS